MTNCRYCECDELKVIIDLGRMPFSNSLVGRDNVGDLQDFLHPLVVRWCPKCLLLQASSPEASECLFPDDYVYFSSCSRTWLDHTKKLIDETLDVGTYAIETVAEIASNDGYALQYVKERGVSCYGVEPTSSTASVCRSKGIEVVQDFFSADLAKKLVRNGKAVDWIIANNVLAHVPDIHDFLKGITELLNQDGIATFEVPYALNLFESCQFDTIYHEHYSYLTVAFMTEAFRRAGLRIFDIQELSTHGGSLRIYASQTTARYGCRPSVAKLLAREMDFGVHLYDSYKTLQSRANHIARSAREFLLNAKRQNLKVIGYGAAAKATIFLNFSKISIDLIGEVLDSNPNKVDKYIPGVNIPIGSVARLADLDPDIIVLFAWNLKDEIYSLLKEEVKWRGRLVVFIPQFEEILVA